MNRIVKASLWVAAFGLILLISVGSISAQAKKGGSVGQLWEDTAINPHDFTNDYYEINGIVGKTIINRRTGSDGLSVFSPSSNPFHTDVRVIATVPAYDQNGGMLFWYPLGEMPGYGFTTDRIGWELRQMASFYPMYVFPHSKIEDFRLFANTRQAALFDNRWSEISGEDPHALGIREVRFVKFTEKAFTEDGSEMMNFMAKKNGMAADDTPILCSMADLELMMKHDLIEMIAGKTETFYGIAPMLLDPTNGVIARDAFLWYATKDGTPLQAEEMFARQFACLQKTGNWCKE